MTFDASEMFALITPVERSTVPLAGDANVFDTHVVMPPFGIGSGVPKLQPVPVHWKPEPAVVVAPSVQLLPLQLTVNRLVEPSGVGPSSTVDNPPPMLRPPHVSVSISLSSDGVVLS
jgi:hypothetical protein